MADSKITALTSIGASTDPANDPLVLVDVSDTSMAASGTTKKVTLNQLLGASGTATLASATITGDLTVDTSTLYVSSSADKVAIGTTSLSNEKLTVAGNISANAWLGRSNISAPAGDCSIFRSADNTLGFGIASSTAMTLNSTGLGVGVTPANDKVLVSQTLGLITSTTADLSFRNIAGTAIQRLRFTDSTGTLTVGSATATAYPVELGGDTVSRAVIIDGSKNVGVGVTPSAWRNTQRALQIGAVGAYFSSAASAGSTCIGRNVYESTAGNFTYIVNDEATLYEQSATGQHAWYTAAASTGTIAFTQAMTLDASGNLLVGTTSSLRNTAHSFKATGASTSYWAAAFQQGGTTSGGRCISLDLPNTNSSSSLFIYATNSSGYAFGLLGNGSLENATGSYGTISDLRLKENISDARNYLADLLKLRVVKYSLKSEASAVATKIGLIAQEVEQVFPTLVETNSDEVKSIKTSVLIPMLLKAIQELTARVEALEA